MGTIQQYQRLAMAVHLIAMSLAWPGNASAGSRIETGEATPIQARAHLDFTVVVPEFLTLGIKSNITAAVPAARNPRSIAIPIELAARGRSQNAVDTQSQLYAIGNAGTLTVTERVSATDGTLSATEEPDSGGSEHAMTYSVSIP